MKYYLKRFFKRRSTFMICGLVLFVLNLLFSDSGLLKIVTSGYFLIGSMYLSYKIGMEFYDFYIGEQSVLESLLPISKKERGKGLILGHVLYIVAINLLLVASLALPLYINYLHLPKVLVQEYGLSETSIFIIEHKWMIIIYGLVTILNSIAYLFLIYNIVEVVMGRWKKKYSYAIYIYLFINFILTNAQKLIMNKYLKVAEIANLDEALAPIFSGKAILMEGILGGLLLILCIGRLYLVLKDKNYG